MRLEGRTSPVQLSTNSFDLSFSVGRSGLDAKRFSKILFLVWFMDLKLLSVPAPIMGGTSNPPH